MTYPFRRKFSLFNDRLVCLAYRMARSVPKRWTSIFVLTFKPPLHNYQWLFVTRFPAHYLQFCGKTFRFLAFCGLLYAVFAFYHSLSAKFSYPLGMQCLVLIKKAYVFLIKVGRNVINHRQVTLVSYSKPNIMSPIPACSFSWKVRNVLGHFRWFKVQVGAHESTFIPKIPEDRKKGDGRVRLSVREFAQTRDINANLFNLVMSRYICCTLGMLVGPFRFTFSVNEHRQKVWKMKLSSSAMMAAHLWDLFSVWEEFV